MNPTRKYKMREPDYEGQMAKSQLYKTMRYSKSLIDMIDDDTQLPSWVQSKLTKVADYIGAVKHYLEGENLNGVVHTVEVIEEESDEDKYTVVVLNKSGKGYTLTDPISKDDAINVAKSTSSNKNQTIKVMRFAKAKNDKNIKIK